MKGTKAVAEKSARLTLKELPFFNYTGNLIQVHSQFNNSLSTFCKTKRDLDKLTCLYDLDLLNTVLDCNLNPDNQSFVRIPSRYYSPHSFRQMKTKVESDTSFSVFHAKYNVSSSFLKLASPNTRKCTSLKALNAMYILRS